MITFNDRNAVLCDGKAIGNLVQESHVGRAVVWTFEPIEGAAPAHLSKPVGPMFSLKWLKQKLNSLHAEKASLFAPP